MFTAVIDGIKYTLNNINKIATVSSVCTWLDDYYWTRLCIPSSIFYKGEQYTVTEIAGSACVNCDTLIFVFIPNTVIEIGDQAFARCNKLSNIIIPQSVTKIGSYAFSGTAWYDNQPDGSIYINNVLYAYKGTMQENTSIDVKEGTVSISPYAFYNCAELISITIPNGVTEISHWTFSGCTKLRNISIPDSVTAISGHSFEACCNLCELNIPNSVTKIGSYAFSETAWYNNQPNGVVYINNVLYAYKGAMPENTSIDVKEGTVSIRRGAFLDCLELRSISIPKSVSEIDGYTFSGCI